MSIKLRLALLLGLLLAVFLVSLFILRRAENQQLQTMLTSSQKESISLIERWLDLTGQSLRQFAFDYSLWDELVTYVKTRDPEWAKINLEASLPNFNAHAVWVLDADGQLVYSVTRDLDELPPPPIGPAEVRTVSHEGQFLHFFVESAGVILEVRGGPIQPSADTERTSPPRGWLLVARKWDDAHLRTLSSLTECQTHLASPDAPPEVELSGEPQISLMRPLPDWSGRNLRMLHLHRQLPEITRVLSSEAFEARTFVLFGILVIVSLGLSLQRWVLQPLGWIGESLSRQDATVIRPLLRDNNELGRVAHLIEDSFAQQAALRESEAALRRTLDERAKLGRDLHDGAIQAIYAAGMGLAAARSQLRGDPAEAEARIDQVRAALNDTIRELRGFINGLEPEPFKERTFAQTVATLIDFLQSMGPVHVNVAIDEALAERLSTTVRTDALQIIREAMSNSIRHGQARLIQLSLRAEQRFAVLEITDDGTGFDVRAVAAGHGLANMAERARASEAEFKLSSDPGNGTRIVVKFPIPDFKIT